jgi:hypothetical protein
MKHFKSVNFVNKWHDGDIHFSRQFVKHLINNIKSDEYVYFLHNISLLSDVENLIKKSISDLTVDIEDNLIVMRGEDLYINTWIGCEARKYLSISDIDKKLYGDSIAPLPNYNVSLGNHYTMYSDILTRLGFTALNSNPTDYIPDVNYSKFNIDNCNIFLNNNLHKKVLFCNNEAKSGQASNFNFEFIIENIATKYPEIQFLITNETNIIKPNIYSTTSIINSKNKSNLEEHGYLSKFCDIIVGRGSGPFRFAATKDTYLNENIRFIGVGHNPLLIFWYYNFKNMKYMRECSVENFEIVFNKCLLELK